MRPWSVFGSQAGWRHGSRSGPPLLSSTSEQNLPGFCPQGHPMPGQSQGHSTVQASPGEGQLSSASFPHTPWDPQDLLLPCRGRALLNVHIFTPFRSPCMSFEWSFTSKPTTRLYLLSSAPNPLRSWITEQLGSGWAVSHLHPFS